MAGVDWGCGMAAGVGVGGVLTLGGTFALVAPSSIERMRWVHGPALRAGGPAADEAARAVGGANHANPLSILVPCHRVIGADGSLTGYGNGLPMKEYLLRLEKKNR